MARLAMSERQSFSGGTLPTFGGGGGYSPQRRSKAKAALRFGIGASLIGALLAVAVWGIGLGVAKAAGWAPGPILQGVLGSLVLGALLGLLFRPDGAWSAAQALFFAVLFSAVLSLCGIAGGSLRLVYSSWLAWPLGGLALGGLVGAIAGPFFED